MAEHEWSLATMTCQRCGLFRIDGFMAPCVPVQSITTDSTAEEGPNEVMREAATRYLTLQEQATMRRALRRSATPVWKITQVTTPRVFLPPPPLDGNPPAKPPGRVAQHVPSIGHAMRQTNRAPTLCGAAIRYTGHAR